MSTLWGLNQEPSNSTCNTLSDYVTLPKWGHYHFCWAWGTNLSARYFPLNPPSKNSPGDQTVFSFPATNFTWVVFFTILVCIMHSHPISHFILPLSVIIFLHCRRISIINKINENVWLMIDILWVSPVSHMKFGPVIDVNNNYLVIWLVIYRPK